MAERVSVQLVDDLDGSEATRTHTVTLDGKTVIVDLNDKNSEKLTKALQPFLDAGRPAQSGRQVQPVPKAGGTRKRSGAAAAGADPRAIRVWGAENGKNIPARGRIPKPIIDEYLAAMGN
jgi:hypothetical protein